MGEYLSRSFAHDRGELCYCTGCRAEVVLLTWDPERDGWDELEWAMRILED